MIDPYLGGCGQRDQCHLSIWMDLYVIISQDRRRSIGKTNVGNAVDDLVERTERLEIHIVDCIQLGHRGVCNADRINSGFGWGRNRFDIRDVLLSTLNILEDRSDGFSVVCQLVESIRYISVIYVARCATYLARSISRTFIFDFEINS